MEENNLKESKNWKKRFNLSNSYYSFFLSFSLAFFFSFLYNFISSPLKKIFPSWEVSFDPFLDLNCYSFVGFLVSFFIKLLSFFSPSNNQFELESSFFSKFLKSNLYCLIKFFTISNYISENYTSQKEKWYFFLISYLFYFFSNYLIETIVLEIEKKGIFDGTTLIFFTSNYQVANKIVKSLSVFEKSPNSETIFGFGLKSNKNLLASFFLVLIFEISVLMSKLRWTLPVENNNFYYPFENYEEKPNFSLDFKLNAYNVLNAQFFFNIFKSILKKIPAKHGFFGEKSQKIFVSFFSKLNHQFPLFFIIPFFQIPYIYFFESKQLAFELNKKGVYFNEISFDKRTRNFLFLKIVQTFLVKHLVLWIIVSSYKFLVGEECFSIIFFISQLLSVFEQSENYRKFMVFYE